jgi:hypothetical protein
MLLVKKWSSHCFSKEKRNFFAENRWKISEFFVINTFNPQVIKKVAYRRSLRILKIAHKIKYPSPYTLGIFLGSFSLKNYPNCGDRTIWSPCFQLLPALHSNAVSRRVCQRCCHLHSHVRMPSSQDSPPFIHVLAFYFSWFLRQGILFSTFFSHLTHKQYVSSQEQCCDCNKYFAQNWQKYYFILFCCFLA